MLKRAAPNCTDRFNGPLLKAQGESKNELQALEEEWLGLQDELEAMTGEFEGWLVG